MRPSALTVIFFILIFMISAIVHVPASFVYGYVPKIKDFDISGLSGTLWDGSATNLTFQGHPLGNFDWTFNPMALLVARIELNIQLAGVKHLSARGVVGYGLNGYYASNLKVVAPSELFQSFVPYPYPIDLSGPVEANIVSYEIERPICSALSGNVTWPGKMGSPLGAVDFGLAMAKLSCHEGAIVLNGESGSDAIQTDFTLKMGPKNGNWSINGWLIPGKALSSSLRTQLGWLGKPDKEGRYMYNFSDK